MNFINLVKLKISYTRANGPDPDDEVNGYTGYGGFPRDAYLSLKGSAENMDWPQGSSIRNFDVPDPKGPNLITDPGTEETWGVRSWHISAHPARVAGKLEIAYYLHDNSDDSAPDDIQTFDLTDGSWDTGDLPIYEGDGSSDFYRLPRIRFTPGPLIIPLEL